MTASIRPGADSAGQGTSLAAPLAIAMFRNLWLSSMVGNQGLLILSVGAAWMMTRLTDNFEMVALVQTALTLPMMLVALPAGALADMFDRRMVAIGAVFISLVGAAILFIVAYLELLSPWPLLSLCFLIGAGYALFAPAWQAAAAEIVERPQLPQAIALNSMSYNAARTVGPAIGGLIVATVGATATFGIAAILYLPLLLVLMMWKRVSVPSRLPPEGLARAILSGGRYVAHSPIVRGTLVRIFAIGASAASILALLPLIARNLIGGGPATFGIALGAYGLGAVCAAFFMQRLRSRFADATIVMGCLVAMSAAIAIVAMSHVLAVTMAALLLFGCCWMAIATIFNINVQLSTPRWVAARAVATFQACIAGGVALGSWLWGVAAHMFGLEQALLGSAAALLVAVVFPRNRSTAIPAAEMHEEVEFPDIVAAMDLTDRSGPIMVELEYRVDPADARQFYQVMQQLRSARARLGAYGWLVARDVSDPWRWTERYHWPTWLDYLRHRTRNTKAERDLQEMARQFHRGDEPVFVRRFLERPYGSVRWREDSFDPGLERGEPDTPVI